MKGPVGGRWGWRQAIERFSPKLVVFGHDHMTPITRNEWHCCIDHDTHCVNVGQTDSGPLHYAVVELRFPQNGHCLPESLLVTAFPPATSIRLP